jgi:hypothetical protein
MKLTAGSGAGPGAALPPANKPGSREARGGAAVVPAHAVEALHPDGDSSLAIE